MRVCPAGVAAKGGGGGNGDVGAIGVAIAAENSAATMAVSREVQNLRDEVAALSRMLRRSAAMEGSGKGSSSSRRRYSEFSPAGSGGAVGAGSGGGSGGALGGSKVGNASVAAGRNALAVVAPAVAFSMRLLAGSKVPLTLPLKLPRALVGMLQSGKVEEG